MPVRFTVCRLAGLFSALSDNVRVPFTTPVVGWVGLPTWCFRSASCTCRLVFEPPQAPRLCGFIVARPCEGHVVEVLKPGEEGDEFAPLVVAGLATHDIKARFEHIAVEDVDVMDALLNAAADRAADLLTIGGFDEGGLALLGRGAGSRYILAHMTLPVLFSH